MSPSDEDKPAGTPDNETERRLADIARLLNVPPTIFTHAANEIAPDGDAGVPRSEVGELLSLFLALAPERRSDLLAHARRLASDGA